jgi:hypothetical protein
VEHGHATSRGNTPVSWMAPEKQYACSLHSNASREASTPLALQPLYPVAARVKPEREVRSSATPESAALAATAREMGGMSC